MEGLHGKEHPEVMSVLIRNKHTFRAAGGEHIPTRRTTRGLFPLKSAGHVTKFALDRAPKFIVRGKLTSDDRVVVHLVAAVSGTNELFSRADWRTRGVWKVPQDLRGPHARHRRRRVHIPFRIQGVRVRGNGRVQGEACAPVFSSRGPNL